MLMLLLCKKIHSRTHQIASFLKKILWGTYPLTLKQGTVLRAEQHAHGSVMYCEFTTTSILPKLYLSCDALIHGSNHTR